MKHHIFVTVKAELPRFVKTQCHPGLLLRFRTSTTWQPTREVKCLIGLRSYANTGRGAIRPGVVAARGVRAVATNSAEKKQLSSSVRPSASSLARIISFDSLQSTYLPPGFLSAAFLRNQRTFNFS